MLYLNRNDSLDGTVITLLAYLRTALDVIDSSLLTGSVPNHWRLRTRLIMPMKRGHPDKSDNNANPALTSKSTRAHKHSFVPSNISTADGLTFRNKPTVNVLEGAESDDSHDHGLRSRKKAEPVKSACVQCQKRKTKCSGARPTCQFCRDRGLICSWDISDGLTRTADLKQKLQDATARSDDLDKLVDAMRCGSDEVSTMLLAKLRLGASVESLLKSIGQEPALTDDSGNLSEVASNPIELSRPGTDNKQFPNSPRGSSSQTNIKQEHGSLDETRRPSHTGSLTSSQNSSFLSSDFDQSRMVWKGPPVLYDSTQRRESAPVMNPDTRPRPWTAADVNCHVGPISPYSTSSDGQMFDFNAYGPSASQNGAQQAQNYGYFGGLRKFGNDPSRPPS